MNFIALVELSNKEKFDMEKSDKQIKQTQIIDVFEKANELFLKEQKDLIISNVAERCWYTSFAIYLNEQITKNNIKGYYVDTEYNRNKGKLKTIFDNENDFKIYKINCDVIVHSRGKNVKQDNLICIEMKKSTASKDAKISDKRRVKILTKDSFDDIWSYDGKSLPEHVCRYKLGVYYEINIRRQRVLIEYYEKGEKVKEYNIDF